MSDLTGKLPEATYKDLLQVSNSNAGVDGTLRPIEDGEGTVSILQVSTAAVAADFTPTLDTHIANKAYVDAHAGGGAFEDDMLHVQDETASGSSGGSFLTGGWRTRVLNTESSNGVAGASLASNQITLGAGTYMVEGLAPAYSVGRHVARLQDVTNAVTLVMGRSAMAGSDNQTESRVVGRFTLAAQAVVELQHRCEQSLVDFGFGLGHDFGTNVFSEVRIWKVG